MPAASLTLAWKIGLLFKKTYCHLPQASILCQPTTLLSSDPERAKKEKGWKNTSRKVKEISTEAYVGHTYRDVIAEGNSVDVMLKVVVLVATSYSILKKLQFLLVLQDYVFI